MSARAWGDCSLCQSASRHPLIFPFVTRSFSIPLNSLANRRGRGLSTQTVEVAEELCSSSTRVEYLPRRSQCHGEYRLSPFSEGITLPVVSLIAQPAASSKGCAKPRHANCQSKALPTASRARSPFRGVDGGRNRPCKRRRCSDPDGQERRAPWLPTQLFGSAAAVDADDK